MNAFERYVPTSLLRIVLAFSLAVVAAVGAAVVLGGAGLLPGRGWPVGQYVMLVATLAGAWGAAGYLCGRTGCDGVATTIGAALLGLGPVIEICASFYSHRYATWWFLRFMFSEWPPWTALFAVTAAAAAGWRVALLQTRCEGRPPRGGRAERAVQQNGGVRQADQETRT